MTDLERELLQKMIEGLKKSLSGAEENNLKTADEFNSELYQGKAEGLKRANDMVDIWIRNFFPKIALDIMLKK